MKTIGLIGGMSWESTVTYYQCINRAVAEALGGLHSAKILLYSVEFAQIEALQSAGEWDRAADILCDAARRLEGAGADFLLICTNTMHKVAPQVRACVDIPLVHIAEVTARALLEQGISKTALLGTKYTMTQDFCKGILTGAGIEVLTPDEADMEEMNRIIFEELCLGILRPESEARCLAMIDALVARGAQAVVLGCTEIGLLVRPSALSLPVFDTTLLHAAAAAELALSPI